METILCICVFALAVGICIHIGTKWNDILDELKAKQM